MPNWMSSVRAEVYSLIESAWPGANTVFDASGANTVTWRELAEAFEQNDASRLQLEPPWVVVDWGELVADDEGEFGICNDAYRWPVMIVLAMSRGSWDAGELEARPEEAILAEAEEAIESMRAAMRAHGGPFCWVEKHAGSLALDNAGNVTFATYNLPFFAVVIDAVLVCGEVGL